MWKLIALMSLLTIPVCVTAEEQNAAPSPPVGADSTPTTIEGAPPAPSETPQPASPASTPAPVAAPAATATPAPSYPPGYQPWKP